MWWWWEQTRAMIPWQRKKQIIFVVVDHTLWLRIIETKKNFISISIIIWFNVSYVTFTLTAKKNHVCVCVSEVRLEYYSQWLQQFVYRKTRERDREKRKSSSTSPWQSSSSMLEILLLLNDGKKSDTWHFSFQNREKKWMKKILWIESENSLTNTFKHTWKKNEKLFHFKQIFFFFFHFFFRAVISHMICAKSSSIAYTHTHTHIRNHCSKWKNIFFCFLEQIIFCLFEKNLFDFNIFFLSATDKQDSRTNKQTDRQIDRWRGIGIWKIHSIHHETMMMMMM